MLTGLIKEGKSCPLRHKTNENQQNDNRNSTAVQLMMSYWVCAVTETDTQTDNRALHPDCWLAHRSSAAMFSQWARPCQCTPSMSMASSRGDQPQALPHLGMLSWMSSRRLRWGSGKASTYTQTRHSWHQEAGKPVAGVARIATYTGSTTLDITCS